SSELAQRDTRLQVTADVKFAFYQVLRRQGEVELARDTLRLVSDLRRRIQVQVEVGEAARLELTRAEAEEAASQVRVKSAELEALTAMAALRAVIGGTLPGNIPVEGAIAPAVTLPPLEDLKKDVLATHPALSAAQSDVRYSEALLNSE